MYLHYGSTLKIYNCFKEVTLCTISEIDDKYYTVHFAERSWRCNAKYKITDIKQAIIEDG